MSFAFGCIHAFASLLLFSVFERASGAEFLGHSGIHDFDAELQSAMASVMGCGEQAGASPHEHVDGVKVALAPMWETLPKNRWGKVDWKMLRYAAHRYFIQQYSVLVKGLEPTRRVNSSVLGSAEILAGTADSVVDKILIGRANGQGFSLDDIAFTLATLERVIYNAETTRLERAYLEMGHQPYHSLAHAPLMSVIETYMMLWMLGDDEESISILLKRPALKSHVFPLWEEIKDFAFGMVKKMEYESSIAPHGGQGRAAMQRSYSFDDAHQATGHITKNFASFWETECQNIKSSLVAMDKLGIGRIPLSDFYGANSDGEWRFGESESYLRELGAMDETSAQRGKQVIIPNYLQGVSNCIVTTPYYLVCCINECEEVLNDIQSAVGAPVASAVPLLGLVQNMTTFDDDPPNLEGALTVQLQRIAQMHSGQIPLHGRLFAQWLHYVFPRECPYPHKAGAASAVTITEFGDESYASDEEVRAHTAARHLSSTNISDVEEAQWMSQWSEDEELTMDYRLGPAPWERATSWLACGCGVAIVLGLAWSLVAGAVGGLNAPGSAIMGTKAKSQFV